MLGLLRLRSNKPVAYTENRPEVLPLRIMHHGNRGNPRRAIQKEFHNRIKQRIEFLENAAINGKSVFNAGFHQLHFPRKLLMFFNYGLGFFVSNNKGTSSRGVKSLKLLRNNNSNNKNAYNTTIGKVTGLNKYYFDQFEGSPHVRFAKATLYQGYILYHYSF